MKNFIQSYRQWIRHNCLVNTNAEKDDLAYWQDHLFSVALTVMVPLSLLAVVPGVYVSFYLGLYTLGVLDILACVWLLIVALAPGMTVITRKALFVSCLYFVSFYLLYIMGLSEPGMLFLFAVVIFANLILPLQYRYLWSWISLFICFLFVPVIQFRLGPSQLIHEVKVFQWLAICANLFFLSFTFSFLLPELLNRLSVSLDRQHRLQETMEEKNKDLEQYAYAISHDLQQPLRTISGFLSLLEKKYNTGLDDKAREYIRFASDGAKKQQEIIRALLDFSRVSRFQPASFNSFQLSEVLEQVKRMLQKQTEETAATISCEEDTTLFTSREAVTQVLHNLVGNALKYHRPGMNPVISVGVKEMPDAWILSVKDNGMGIEKEYFDKIFGIFQRLNPETGVEGTGIGLALVKRIAEKLNGTVWLESVPGTGSRFYFRIPKNPEQR